MNSAQESFSDIQWLVLGGGAVAVEYHLPAFEKLGLIQNVTVVDALEENLNSIKKTYPLIAVEKMDYRKFFSGYCAGNKALRAAVITLPNCFHAEAAELAMDHGLSVLCEKPFVMASNTCQALMDKAKNLNLILAVGMVRRLLPSVAAAFGAVKKGLIGDILSMEIKDGGSFNWQPHSHGYFRKENGGVLANMGIHYLDMAEFFLGALEPMEYEDDSRGGVEANCRFLLKSAKNQIPVSIEMSYSHSLSNIVRLKGAKGELLIEKDTDDFCRWVCYETGLRSQLRSDKPFQSGNWPQCLKSCFIEQLHQFANSVQRKEKPFVQASEALPAIRNMEWAYGQSRIKQKLFFISYSENQSRPKLKPSPVLITGGSGFVGGHLIERLSQLAFDSITVPTRSYQRVANAARFPVQFILADILDKQNMQKAICGKRYVFHLAYGSDGEKKQQKRATVEGTKNIVETAIAEGVECVVIVSTTAVFKVDATTTFLDETRPYKKNPNTYESGKIEMEKYCLSRAKTSGKTRIIVLNPSHIYGPRGSSFTELPSRLAQKNSFVWIDAGSGVMNYTYVDNFVDAMIAACACGVASGQRFIINDGACAWKEFLSPILGAKAALFTALTKVEFLKKCNQEISDNRKKILRSIFTDKKLIELANQEPFFRRIKMFLKTFAPLVERKVKQIRRQESFESEKPSEAFLMPPLWFVDLFGTNSSTLSSRKAGTVLGWSPKVTLPEGQARSIEWLKSVGILN